MVELENDETGACGRVTSGNGQPELMIYRSVVKPGRWAYWSSNSFNPVDKLPVQAPAGECGTVARSVVFADRVAVPANFTGLFDQVGDLARAVVMIPHNVPVTLYICASCEHPLTGDLLESEAVPVGDHLSDHRVADPRVAQGTYAINYNATLFILHPDDVPGTALHPDRSRRAGCCGLDGQDGPNLVCTGCGAEVATKESDCWTDNLVALIAAAVVSRTQSPS